VGRLDDWLKVQAEKKNISTDAGYLEWPGYHGVGVTSRRAIVESIILFNA
jgi:hypothetical protein